MHLIIVKLLNNFKSSLYKLLIISHYSCRGRKIREKFDDATQHPVHKTTFERPSHQKRWRHWTRVRGGKRRWRHASPGVARQAAAAGSGRGGRKGARLRALRRVGEERVRGSRRVSGVLQREPDGCRGNWRRGGKWRWGTVMTSASPSGAPLVGAVTWLWAKSFGSRLKVSKFIC